MTNVTIGTKQMFTDFALYLKSKEIGFPKIKTNTVDVEGRNGVIDLSEAFGEIQFGNRTIKLILVTKDAFSYNDTLETLANYLHGKKQKIWFSDDPDFYYYGRIKLNAFKSDRRIGTIELECDCDPFKRKNSVTSVVKAVTTTQSTLTITNERMTCVPSVIATVACTLVYGEFTTTISPGTTTIPTLQLAEGSNVIKLTGSASGTVTFNFQEGAL